MKKLFLIMLMLTIGLTSHGQKVGKIDMKNGGFGQKKMSKAPKKVYISEFNINYQLAYSQTSISRGGSQIGGSYRGDAKASLSVAIPDIDLDALQKITDDVYQEYIDKLKSEGFEIIDPETAVTTDLLSGWERQTGGEMSEAQFPGYVATTPTGKDYFVRRVTKKGRKKNGIFEYASKLSRQLEGATVVKINLAIPFVEEAEGGVSKSLRKTIGGLAKVVVKPNFRLAKYESVQVGNTYLTVQTGSSYHYMESMKNQGQILQTLKKDVKIEGVFESKKYKATQKADQDIWGASNGFYKVFSYEDRELARTQAIECDPQVYLKGVREVVKGYVESSLNTFLTASKGK